MHAFAPEVVQYLPCKTSPKIVRTKRLSPSGRSLSKELAEMQPKLFEKSRRRTKAG
jgi:hypothetical protein